MKSKTSKDIGIYAVVAVLLVIVTYSFADSQISASHEAEIATLKQVNLDTIATLNQTHITEITALEETNNEFLTDYSIALNNIHIGTEDIDLGSANRGFGRFYANLGYYYAEDLLSYFVLGGDQILEGKERLTKAKAKLQQIEGDAPNEFFKEDVADRLEQVDVLLEYADNSYKLSDYYGDYIYAIQYGTTAEVDMHLDKFSDVIDDYNDNLDEIKEIQSKIDVHWDQDWYVE